MESLIRKLSVLCDASSKHTLDQRYVFLYYAQHRTPLPLQKANLGIYDFYKVGGGTRDSFHAKLLCDDIRVYVRSNGIKNSNQPPAPVPKGRAITKAVSKLMLIFIIVLIFISVPPIMVEFLNSWIFLSISPAPHSRVSLALSPEVSH